MTSKSGRESIILAILANTALAFGDKSKLPGLNNTLKQAVLLTLLHEFNMLFRKQSQF